MSITEYFKDKTIFITGGSGFIGKCLIEKLLRSCEGIQKIYVLLRKKKGQTAEERLENITGDELFNVLKMSNPEAIKKLIPICGDVAECKLGMGIEDRQTVIKTVNVIYHVAASVRFDDFLKDSILTNTRGTREMVELALELHNLEAFMHISTTFCNADRRYIEETLYPSYGDWRSAITLAENLDQHTLNVFSEKYIEPLPNTYTYAKSLSEHVVNDLCVGRIPAVILRPSIVVCTADDPEPGWLDNFNGPVGVLTAGSKGLIKVMLCNAEDRMDIIPVDVLVKMIIVSTHERVLNRNIDEVTVYNASLGDHAILTYGTIQELGNRLTWDAPFEEVIWYPHVAAVRNWYIFYIFFIFYQLLPALVVDGLLRLTAKETKIFKIQRIIFSANCALVYFMRNTWKFVNQKSIDLTLKVTDYEQQTFGFSRNLNMCRNKLYTLLKNGKKGSAKYLFKENIGTHTGLRKTYILWILDWILHISLFGVSCWYLIAKVNIFGLIASAFQDYLLYFETL